MLRTLLNKLRWSFRKNSPDLLALMRRDYPDFIFNHKPLPLHDEIPVFVFHSVEPVSFEKKLQFLAQNNYRTLTGEEFRAAIAGETRIQKNSVVLTFDDGRATLWTVAFPLLRRYGFRAISFIVPGCIMDCAPESPTFADYEKKRVPVLLLLAREQSDEPLCSWQEIREMHESGVIDFQSHTMFHHLTAVSPQIVDFIHPDYDRNFGDFNVPAYHTKGKSHFTRQMPFGTPVYRFEPRTYGKLQYFDDDALRSICIQYVARHQGEQFFKTKNWRTKLYRVYCAAQRKSTQGSYETPQQQSEAIFDDLLSSKKAIEQHLRGKTVDQLCYPWFLGSPLAVEQSRRAGYRVNYWGALHGRSTNSTGDDLFYVPRLDEQYVFRLPGKGRRPLSKIQFAKIADNLPGFMNRLTN